MHQSYKDVKIPKGWRSVLRGKARLGDMAYNPDWNRGRGRFENVTEEDLTVYKMSATNSWHLIRKIK